MRSAFSRLVALLLAILLLIPLFGCAFLNPPTGSTTPSATTPAEPSGDGGYDLRLRYDDRVTLDGRFLRLESSTADGTDLLLASRTESDTFTVRATNVGEGVLYINRDGAEVLLRVRVEPAPLHVLLILGEAVAAGDAEPMQTPRAADGLVYYTSPGATRPSGLAELQNVSAYFPISLTSPRMSAAGTPLPVPLDELTTSGSARYAGLAAPIAYQYAEMTGERVWSINLAEPGASITDYCPNEVDPAASPALYRGAKKLWDRAERLLRTELERGHYRLEDFGFFYAGGEGDAAMSEEAYYTAFSAMKRALDRDFCMDPGKTGSTRSLAFGGVILPRAGYTTGPAMTEENGVRRALRRIDAEESPLLGNVHLLATVVDLWDTDEHIALYFSRYDYRNFTFYYGYTPPKTTATLFGPSGHYTAAAANELGYVAVCEMLSPLQSPQ